MKYKLIFVAILLLSIFLRFYKLGSFPPGFRWDEAAIGYNAWGILTVNRDEWLSRMPLSFRSFGDYKSPLAIYITAVSEKIFGPTVYAVRFPTAVAGVGLVVASYFLVKQLREHEESETSALIVMLLVAVSPWALHFSSIAFESMIAVCLATFGTVFFLKGIRKTKYMILSGILYSLSLYAYHSAKLVVPLTILVLLYIHREALKPLWKTFAIFFLTCVVVAAPLVYVSLFGKASDRFFGSTAILDASKKLKPISEVTSILSSHFASHLTSSYLFFGGETTYRQSNMVDGILSPAEGVLILLALIFALGDTQRRKTILILIVFIVISILPATLGNDVPHANRALMGLPWFQVLAGFGALCTLEWLRKKKGKQLISEAICLFFLMVVGGLVWHLQNDAKAYATSVALSDLQYGEEEAVQYARSQESTVEKVYITNKYQQEYIFLLFFKHMNPIDYRGGGLANYVITDHPYADAQGQKNVLIIGTADDIPPSARIEKEIKYPDGNIA